LGIAYVAVALKGPHHVDVLDLNIDFYCWFKDLTPYGSSGHLFTPRDILGHPAR
jgi:hypothetical protein